MPIEDNSTTRINIAHTSPFADEVHSEIDVVNNSNHLQASDFEGILSAWTQYQQVSMSIPFLSNILFMANDGSSSDQAAVFQAILDKEPIIMAHLQTRKTSIMGVDWDIMGDNSYKCSEIKRIMEDAGYHDLIPHLLDCIGNGYAGAGITWEAGWRSIQTFIKVNHTNWIFDKYGNIALIKRDGSQVPITQENAHTVVFHQYQMRSGIPSQGGVLRPLVWTYFFKHVITKEQVRYLEKYGMPMLIGKLSEADFNNESVRPKIKAMLRNLAAQGCGVINQTTDIQSIKVDSAAGGNADYLRFIEHCNEVYAKTILGQTASSGNAGGMSKGQMQENVRKDILKSDCMSLMSTINNQIVKRLEYNRWGTNECTFKMDIEEAEDLESLAKNVIAFAGIGLKAKRSWLEDKFNIPFEEEAPVQPMAGLGALGGGMPSLPPMGGGSPMTSTLESTATPTPSGSTATPPVAEPTVPDMSSAIPSTTTPMNDFKKKAHLISLADIDSEYHSIIDDSIKDSELPDEIKSEVINPDIRDSVQYEQHINDKLTNIALQQPEYADAINNIRQNVGNVDMNTIIEKAQARKQTATQAPQFLQEDEEQEAELTPEESELKLRLDKTTIPTEEEKAQEEQLKKAEEEKIYKEPKKELTVEQIAKKYGINIDASTAITRGNARTNFNLAVSWALITSGKELPPEQIEEFRKLNEALEKQDVKATEDSSWIGKQLSSFAESIPSLINGLIQGGAGALITAVPTLGLGSLPGFGIGMGQYMARESAGQMYANMVFNENVQPDIARAASIIGAIPIGALNFLQFKKLSNFVPGGKQTVEALINKPIENVSKIVATDLMAEFAKHQVQGTAIQATQLATERVITEGAKAVEASIDGSEYSVDVKDQLKNIAFGTMASIIPNMMMSGVFLPLNVKEYKGTVIDAKARGDAQRRAKRIAEELESKMVPEKEIKPVADLIQEPKNEKPIDLETDANQVFLTKEQIDTQLANYLKDNPRAKDTTIEFVSKDNPALENQNGVFDRKENKIYINQDNITSDKNLTGLLAHEDFSHKFLESTISRNERTNLINAIDKLIKSGDNTFWDAEKETKYKELYSKDVDAFNKVDNEKIASFIAERGYEALDKNSKEFAPIRKLVEWFKAHFAHIFGKASEEEVLHYLSNTFKKYRDEKFKPVESQDKTSSFAIDSEPIKHADIVNKIESVGKRSMSSVAEYIKNLSDALKEKNIDDTTSVNIRDALALARQEYYSLNKVIDNAKELYKSGRLNETADKYNELLENIKDIDYSSGFSNSVLATLPKSLIDSLNKHQNNIDNLYRDLKSSAIKEELAEGKAKGFDSDNLWYKTLELQLAELQKASPSVSKLMGTKQPKPTIKLNINQWYKEQENIARKAGKSVVKSLDELYQMLDKEVKDFAVNNFPDNPEAQRNLINDFNKVKNKALHLKGQNIDKITDRALDLAQNTFNKALDKETNRQNIINEKINKLKNDRDMESSKPNPDKTIIADYNSKIDDLNYILEGGLQPSKIIFNVNDYWNKLNKVRRETGKATLTSVNDLLKFTREEIDNFVNNNDMFINKEQVISDLNERVFSKLDTRGNVDSKIINLLNRELNKALDKERTKQTDVASKIVATLTPDEFKELTNLSDKGYESLTPEQRQAWWDTNETLESLNQKIAEQLSEKAKVSELLLAAQKGGGTFENLKAAADTHDRLINIYKKQKQALGGIPTIEDIISTVDNMKQSDLKANVRGIINNSGLTSISDFKIGSIKADLKNLISDYDKSDISNRGKILLKINDVIAKAKEQDEIAQHDKLVRRVQDAQDKIRASIDNKKVIVPEAVDNLNKWLGKFNEFTPEEMTEYINISEKPNYDYTVDELSLITRYYYQGKKIKDLTSSQLKEHLEDLKSIQKDNKSLVQAQYDAKKAELNKNINEIVDTINSSSKTKGVVTTFEQLPTESGIQPKSVVDKAKVWAKVLWRRPEDIVLAMCNNNPESFLYKTLFLNGFNSRTAQLVNDNESYNFMKGNYKDFLISTKAKVKNNDFTFDIDMVQAENTAEKGKPANNYDANSHPIFVKGASKQYEGTPTVSLSLHEMASIYAHNQNIANYLHLMNTLVDVWYTDKNGKKQLLLDESGKQRRVKITPELVDLVVKKMTMPDDKGGFKSYADMVDRQIDYYSEVQWGRINKTFKAIHGYDMEKVERYIPISFLKDFNGASDEGLIYMNMKRNAMRGVAKGVTIDRIDGARQGFNNLDWGDVITKNALQSNYYMSWAEHINNVNKIMSDPKVKEAMDAKFPGAYDALLEQYKTQATGRIERVAGDDLISLARNIFSVATLGLKVPTLLIQIPFGLVSRYSTPFDANLKSTYAFMKDITLTGGKTTRDFVNSASAFMRTRVNSEILQKYSTISENTQTGYKSLFNGKSWSDGELMKAMKEIMAGNIARAAGHTVKAISGGTQLIMYPIAAVEQFMAEFAWKSHYDYLANDKQLSLKYDHNKRVEICDNIVRGTTPIFDVRFQSQLMNSPGFRALTLFKGPQAQLTSNIVQKLIGAMKGDAAGGEAYGGSARDQFIKIAAISVVTTMLTQLIRSGFTSTPWEDKEDYVKAYYDNMFGGEFISGTLVQAGLDKVSNMVKERKGEEQEPYFSRNNNILSLYLDVATGVIQNPDDSKKWLKLAKSVLPISSLAFSLENSSMRDMLFNSGNARDKMKAVESYYTSGFAMNLKRDYPLSYVMGKGYQMVDERIKEYNKKNPDKAWHPAKISDVLKLKDGIEIQLGSYDYYMRDEYSDYLNLINEYIDHSGGLNELFGYSSLEEYDIKKLKSILARAKEYAKTTLSNDPAFGYRHRAEIAKASNLIE